MNQVVRQEDPNAVVHADPQTIMEVISRAANDPNTDVDKLERLMGLYERIEARNSEQGFNEAMSQAQSEMRPIAADSNNPQTRSRYASFSALDKAMRPIYTKNGFGLSFDTGEGAPDTYVRVVCHVSHRDGYSRKYHVDMPADGKGAKGGDVMTKTHAVGSAMTYGQRYLLKLIFNVAVGEDDDGNRSTNVDRITDEQAMALRDLLESTGAPKDKFLKWAKIQSLEDLPAAHYDSAVMAIKAAGKKAQS
jgi:hypothetical protein